MPPKFEKIINTYVCELDSEPVYDGKYIKTKLTKL